LFNQKKDYQTYTFTNTNYAIIAKYKFREVKVLNHYGSWWGIAGVVVEDK